MKKMEIREQKGEYAVIARGTSFQPYVVAWLPRETKNGLEWAQGYYFNDYLDALKFYQKKLIK